MTRLRAMVGAAAAAALVLAAGGRALADPPPANPFEGSAEAVETGKSMFGQNCAHCHGPGAISPERPRDLRRLKIRYGDDMSPTYWKTVQEGRVARGMPSWHGVLDDATLWRIYTYLETVQKTE